MRILPIAEVKAKLNQLVADVAATDEAVTITRNGRAAAVLVSHEEFESWEETADIVADPEFLAEIRKGIADLKKGRGKTVGVHELDALFAAPPAPRRRRR